MDDKEYFARILADVILKLGFIPTPREIEKSFKKDKTVSYKRLVEVFGGESKYYNSAIKMAKDQLSERGFEVGAYGIRPLKKQRYEDATKNSSVSESKPNTNDRKLQIDDQKLVDRVVQMYDDGFDLTMENLAFCGLSADEVLKRVCVYLNIERGGLTEKVKTILKERKIVKQSGVEQDKSEVMEMTKNEVQVEPKVEMESAEMVSQSGTDEELKARVDSKKNKNAQEYIKVLREFAEKNLRWPTESEIRRFKAEKISGWLSVATLHRKLGHKKEWAAKLFPDGLPKGFGQDSARNDLDNIELMIEENNATKEGKVFIPIRIIVPENVKISGTLSVTIKF